MAAVLEEIIKDFTLADKPWESMSRVEAVERRLRLRAFDGVQCRDVAEKLIFEAARKRAWSMFENETAAGQASDAAEPEDDEEDERRPTPKRSRGADEEAGPHGTARNHRKPAGQPERER
jgi:hypothetical protein